MSLDNSLLRAIKKCRQLKDCATLQNYTHLPTPYGANERFTKKKRRQRRKSTLDVLNHIVEMTNGIQKQNGRNRRRNSHTQYRREFRPYDCLDKHWLIDWLVDDGCRRWRNVRVQLDRWMIVMSKMNGRKSNERTSKNANHVKSSIRRYPTQEKIEQAVRVISLATTHLIMGNLIPW